MRIAKRILYAVIFIFIIYGNALAAEGEWIMTENLIKMYGGETFDLGAQLTNEGFDISDTDNPIIWRSDNPAVKVDEYGVLSTSQVENTTFAFITAGINGEYKVWKLKINTASERIAASFDGVLAENDIYFADLSNGEKTVEIAVDIYPENALQRSDISISDTKIAELSGKNKNVLKIKEYGTFDLTITSADGHSEKKYTIKSGIPVSDIEISGDKIYTSGTTARLTAKCTPDEATEKNVVWTSSNSEIINIESSGKLNVGTVTSATPVRITATAADGSGVKVDYSILVKPKTEAISFLVNGEETTSHALIMDKALVGTTWRITAKTLPTDANKSVLWASSDSKIASVDNSGLLTVNSEGECFVACKATDGSGFRSGIYCIVTDISQNKYYMEVDRSNQVVRIYEKDARGLFTKLIRRMVCSTGTYDNTLPDGVYKIEGRKLEWMTTVLTGVCAQYGTRIFESIWFHSIPYYGYHADKMDTAAYKELGQNKSHGCIRLLCADAKWIHDNIEPGTYLVSCSFGPMSAERASLKWPKAQGTWDPTDDNPNNPYYDGSYTSEVE